MNRDQLLGLMRRYFEDRGDTDPALLAGFEHASPRALLKESLDVVDFVVYLEEALERDIDLARLGSALQQESFGALATEAAGWLAEE